MTQESFFDKLVLTLFGILLGGVCLYMTLKYGIHFYTLGVFILLLPISQFKGLVSSTNEYFLKNNNMEKVLKIFSALGVLIITLSIGYYFVYRPLQKEMYIKQCDEQTEWSTNLRLKEKWQLEYDKCLREKGI